MDKYREALEKIATHESNVEDYYGGVAVNWHQFSLDLIEIANKALLENAPADPWLLLRKIKQAVNNDNFSSLQMRAAILDLIHEFEKTNSCII